jgi:lipopolysaccharide export system protein LptC
MSTSGRLALLILAALAAGSWWLNEQVGRSGRLLEERPAAEGFYMTEAEITSAGPDGLPRYRVIADEIRQRSLRGETLLENVRVEYNIYSASPWTLTAPAGVLSADQALVELWGGVELVGDSSDFGVATMQTERLEVDTRAHIARTASPVALGVGPQQVHAIGMVAYLLDERVQLQSEVHGRFLP